ncbi:hypothetical protein ACO1K8_14655, partial [Staphylococcus aureus]
LSLLENIPSSRDLSPEKQPKLETTSPPALPYEPAPHKDKCEKKSEDKLKSKQQQKRANKAVPQQKQVKAPQENPTQTKSHEETHAL